MPTIKYKDGRVDEVPYTKAAQINDMITGQGREKPTPEQIAYLETVEDVVFEAREQRVYKTRRFIEHDTKIDTILKDDRLSGYDRFLAVGRRIRERVVV